MSDLRLRYEGNGVFKAATHLDFETACETYTQGDVLNASLSKPRSVSQNRFFHALVEAAYENQRSGPRLASWKALKGYLLIEAGHCLEKRVKLPRGTQRSAAVAIGQALVLLIRSSEEYVGLAYDPNTNELVARYPGSMRMRGQGAMGGEEANHVVDKVVDVICSQIVPGADPMLLMSDARARIGAPERKKAA